MRKLLVVAVTALAARRLAARVASLLGHRSRGAPPLESPRAPGRMPLRRAPRNE